MCEKREKVKKKRDEKKDTIKKSKIYKKLSAALIISLTMIFL